MSKFGADPVASLALILTAIWPALFSHRAQGWTDARSIPIGRAQDMSGSSIHAPTV